MKPSFIKIMPRPKEKTPLYIKVLFPASICLLLLAIGLSFFLKAQNASLSLKKEEIRQKLIEAQAGTRIERELFSTVAKIREFSRLKAKRKEVFPVLSFIQKSCHPQIMLKKMQVDLAENRIIIGGEALNFRSLSEQIVVFKRSKEIKSLKVADVFKNRRGRVEFIITLNVDQKAG